jgi:hypothetical protein
MAAALPDLDMWRSWVDRLCQHYSADFREALYGIINGLKNLDRLALKRKAYGRMKIGPFWRAFTLAGADCFRAQRSAWQLAKGVEFYKLYGTPEKVRDVLFGDFDKYDEKDGVKIQMYIDSVCSKWSMLVDVVAQ